ncbi:ERCC4 domain-containing protein [Balamuthia mandrillaris]
MLRQSTRALLRHRAVPPPPPPPPLPPLGGGWWGMPARHRCYSLFDAFKKDPSPPPSPPSEKSSSPASAAPPPPVVSRPASPKDFDLLGEPDPASPKVFVNGYTDDMFAINNVRATGPIFVSPTSYFRWNVSSLQHLTPESLMLATLLYPSVRILLLGTGSRMQYLPGEFYEYMRHHKIALEVMSTSNACGTFNLLNQEDREVAVALLPAGWDHSFPKI